MGKARALHGTSTTHQRPRMTLVSHDPEEPVMGIVTHVSPSRKRSIARTRNHPGDPATEAVPVPLPGGRVVELRPLRRGERDTLLAVFDGMSSTSRAQRYLTGMVRLPSTVVEALIDVDGHRHVAWVASEHGQPVGIARLVRDAAGAADLAVEVVDAHHGL